MTQKIKSVKNEAKPGEKEGGAGETSKLSDSLTIEFSDNSEEDKIMIFTGSLLLAGGATIVLAIIDKTCEDLGYYWIGTVVRIALPVAAFAAGIYFIETNAILGWMR